MRVVQRFAAFLILALLLSSCLRVESDIKINDDGSGKIEAILAVNADVLIDELDDSAAPGFSKGQKTDLVCDQVRRSGQFPIPPGLEERGGTQEPYRSNRWCGYKFSLDLPAQTSHKDALDLLFQDNSANQLQKIGDNWLFSTTLNQSAMNSGLNGLDPDPQLRETIEYKVKIELPGQPVAGQNNATSVSGNTFEWDIDVFDPPERLYAETEPASGLAAVGLSPLSLVAIGAIVFSIVGILVFFLRSEKPAPAPQGDALIDEDPWVTEQKAKATAAGHASAPAGQLAAPAALVDPWVEEQKRLAAASGPQSAAGIATAVAQQAAPVAPAPVFDERRNAWVLNDPAQGWMQHDAATDTWHPLSN